MTSTSVNSLLDYRQNSKPATDLLETEHSLPNGQNTGIRDVVIRARNPEKTKRAFWRRVVYKGADHTNSLSKIFNKNYYPTIVAALALQVLYPSNSDPSLIFNPSRVWEQLSVITEVPGNCLLSLLIPVIPFVTLKILGIKDEGPERDACPAIPEDNSSIDETTRIIKTRAMAAIKEEIFFRCVIQGSLASLGTGTGMEVHSANFYARMAASALLGLAQTKQSLAQAITAAISGYYIYGRLYAEKGLLAATTAHFANNVIATTLAITMKHLGRACAKPDKKEPLHAA